MSVTVKDIANAAGVSRGTVDRVLHDRGAVKAEVALRVKALAKEMGYVPNRVGRALASYKTRYKIGVMLPSVGNPFFDEVIEGIEAAHREYKDLGVDILIKKIQGYDEKIHVAALMELVNSDCEALCVSSINSEKIHKLLNDCYSAGKKIILLNSDLENTRRLCFIGPDYFKSGQTSAGMLSMIHRDEKLRILIITGSKQMLGHNQRIEGFKSELEKLNNSFEILDVLECNDSEITAQQITSSYLKEHPEVNCVFVAAAGVQGVGAALIAHSDSHITAMAFDDIYSTKELVKAGILKFVVCQQPRRQGYHAIKKAYLALAGLIPEKTDDFITDTLIKIKSNLD